MQKIAATGQKKKMMQQEIHAILTILIQWHRSLKVYWLWNKGVRFPGASCSCCPTNTMDVVFAVCWNIKIDNYIHMWNIKAPTAGNIMQ